MPDFQVGDTRIVLGGAIIFYQPAMYVARCGVSEDVKYNRALCTEKSYYQGSRY